jgi:hypothetical protein
MAHSPSLIAPSLATPGVRQIVFAVAPHLVLLDACGPLEAFWRAELEMRNARGSKGDEPVAYRTRVASVEGGTLATHVGLPIVVERLDALEDETIDTVIVAGTFVADRASAACARFASVRSIWARPACSKAVAQRRIGVASTRLPVAFPRSRSMPIRSSCATSAAAAPYGHRRA